MLLPCSFICSRLHICNPWVIPTYRVLPTRWLQNGSSNIMGACYSEVYEKAKLSMSTVHLNGSLSKFIFWRSGGGRSNDSLANTMTNCETRRQRILYMMYNTGVIKVCDVDAHLCQTLTSVYSTILQICWHFIFRRENTQQCCNS